ncbi:MAG TPA: endolytic transglycosylase MltG [Acidimicrobiales bacterium]|nr:endolytic transglycosylase MltG [Acidimicrobiales bacterium]
MTHYHPVEPRRRRRWPMVLLGLLAAVLLVVAMAAVWLQRQFDPPGAPGAQVEIVLPAGASTQRIAAILDAKGVVGSARVFRLYVKLNGGGPFQAGRYTLRRDLAFGDVVDALSKGPEITYQRLTIPEGYTLEQIAARVGKLPGRSADDFLAAARSGAVRSQYQPPGSTNLEGLLLPETYNIEPDDDETAILRLMVTEFDTVAAGLGLDEAKADVGITPYQAVVVASLVEREARVDEDRGPIAGVIYNRLEKGMLLQVDATVLYALGSHKTRVLFKDLEIDSPYNTYRVKGLPPTPIAAPGRAALRAALGPPKHDYLYYVVIDSKGRHAFAATGAEHTRNIRKAKENGVR